MPKAVYKKMKISRKLLREFKDKWVRVIWWDAWSPTTGGWVERWHAEHLARHSVAMIETVGFVFVVGDYYLGVAGSNTSKMDDGDEQDLSQLSYIPINNIQSIEEVIWEQKQGQEEGQE